MDIQWKIRGVEIASSEKNENVIELKIAQVQVLPITSTPKHLLSSMTRTKLF
jgi:hypothetical protein